MKRLDVGAGQVYARLTVVRELLGDSDGRRMECLCECGAIAVVRPSDLIHGRMKSCGCLRREVNASNGTHFLSKTEEYKIWKDIVRRCCNPKRKEFQRYGGRGILIAAEWRHDFPAFLKYVGVRPGPEYSIERIDNNAGYLPGNIKWATDIEQARNKRNNHIVTFRGLSLTVAEWSERLGLGRKLAGRLRAGWSLERAFTANGEQTELEAAN